MTTLFRVASLAGAAALLAASLHTPVFALSTNSIACTASGTTLTQPGYITCLGSFPGNNDDGILNFERAQTGKFVIGIKQENAFSLSLYDGGHVISHARFFGTPTSLVPEPQSYGLMLVGLTLLTAVTRRRKQVDAITR